MKVLVTGGTGYIGSHTCLRLVEEGHEVVVVDNVSNSSIESIKRVSQLTDTHIDVLEGDVRSKTRIDAVIAETSPEAVIHFAGLKSVAESVRFPDKYYETNLGGTLNVARAALQGNVAVVLFSSSATVYGESASMPVDEGAATEPTNPYGRSKLYAESVLRDLNAANPALSVGVLRYFNPVGAHPSGVIGEDPRGTPANLMPYVARVAAGTYPELSVYGDDYSTADGTGIRDYIHVMDLADAHVKVMEYKAENSGFETWNVGRGSGVSVLEMVSRFQEVTGKSVPTKIVPRRAGDVAVSFANVSRIARDIGWSAKYELDDMVADLWHWQSQNPEGYE
ncbi:MAG: UDP-glucose 4-epimerase GalE [Micrococcus sp.]|nr:UDP-glucose 4-epimerase GalE [Micrococcus sp.]